MIRSSRITRQRLGYFRTVQSVQYFVRCCGFESHRCSVTRPSPPPGVSVTAVRYGQMELYIILVNEYTGDMGENLLESRPALKIPIIIIY